MRDARRLLDFKTAVENLLRPEIEKVVARSTDGSGLDGGCEDDVSRLTPGLHPETTFDMNDLPSNTYTLDTRRMQLYSHPHVHPTLVVMMTLSSQAPRYRNTELVLSKMSSSPSVTSPTLFV
ncbi:hypothetical protein SFRURICE_006492 [Spodoptera frugiperda]|nr:hypothetical protein SFRURICE_006492 [Spodoptera frugiperda]